MLGSAYSFPVVVIGSLIVAWILLALGQPQIGFYVSLLALLNGIAGLIALALLPRGDWS
jgi:hypothetical protein